MKIVRTSAFEKDLADAPHEIQQLCERQLELLTANNNDPRLHHKPLKEQCGVHSFRVTRRYRGLFFINERKQIIVFAIDHRKDAYR